VPWIIKWTKRKWNAWTQRAGWDFNRLKTNSIWIDLPSTSQVGSYMDHVDG
jgi:hypothetical protein